MSPKALRCLTFLLKNEGGWKQKEAGDPETYRGISRDAYPHWIGWKLVDEAKPLHRGQVIAALEPEVLAFYEALLWEKYRLEELDEPLALVILDYFANSGAGPSRYMRLEPPVGPFDVLRDRGHYMVDLACGFVSQDPTKVAYWTRALAGGWSRRLADNLEAVRKLGAVLVKTPAVVPAKETTMFKGSWRTTAAAIVLALTALLTGASALLDDDPGTVPDWGLIAAQIAAAAGFAVARDEKVTSASLGLK